MAGVEDHVPHQLEDGQWAIRLSSGAIQTGTEGEIKDIAWGETASVGDVTQLSDGQWAVRGVGDITIGTEQEVRAIAEIHRKHAEGDMGTPPPRDNNNTQVPDWFEGTREDWLAYLESISGGRFFNQGGLASLGYDNGGAVGFHDPERYPEGSAYEWESRLNDLDRMSAIESFVRDNFADFSDPRAAISTLGRLSNPTAVVGKWGLQAVLDSIKSGRTENPKKLNAQGGYLNGATDGMADQLNTTIEGTQPAALSDGEFVVPADVVGHLGNGNSDAGAEQLYAMMDRIRMDRTGTTEQGRQIDPNQYMPRGIA